MMYVMHHAFRRDLAKLAEAAQCTPVERPGRLAAAAAALGASSPRRCTGTTPARTPACGRCCSSAAPTEDRETLEAMEAEHAEFDPLLEACEAGLRAAGRARRRRRPRGPRRPARGDPGVPGPAPRARGDRGHPDHPAGAHARRTGSASTRSTSRRTCPRARSSGSSRGRRTASRARCSTASSPRPGFGFKLVWLATRRRFARRRRAPSATSPEVALEAVLARGTRSATTQRAGSPTRHTSGQHRPRAGWRGPARRSPAPPSRGRCRPGRSPCPTPTHAGMPANGSSRSYAVAATSGAPAYSAASAGHAQHHRGEPPVRREVEVAGRAAARGPRSMRPARPRIAATGASIGITWTPSTLVERPAARSSSRAAPEHVHQERPDQRVAALRDPDALVDGHHVRGELVHPVELVPHRPPRDLQAVEEQLGEQLSLLGGELAGLVDQRVHLRDPAGLRRRAAPAGPARSASEASSPSFRARSAASPVSSKRRSADAGAPDAERHGEQRVQQQVVVAETAGHRERLVAQRLPLACSGAL